MKNKLISAACAILLAGFLLPVPSAPGELENIDRQASLKFHEAYDMMYVGRTLELQHLNEEALGFYMRALDKLNEIQADFPDWRPEPISERIEHCTERITTLSGEKPNPVFDKTQGPPVVPEKIRSVQEQAVKRQRPGISDDEKSAEFMIAHEMEAMADFGSAIEIYQELFENNSDNLNAIHGLLRCYIASGQAGQAMSFAEHAAVKNRTDLKSKTLIAMAYSVNGRHEDAVQILRQAGSEVFFDDSACVTIGIALAGSARDRDAIAYMKRAIELNPERPDAFYNLTRLFAGQTKPDLNAARENYRAYLNAGGEPDDALARTLR